MKHEFNAEVQEMMALFAQEAVVVKIHFKEDRHPAEFLSYLEERAVPYETLHQDKNNLVFATGRHLYEKLHNIIFDFGSETMNRWAITASETHDNMPQTFKELHVAQKVQKLNM